MLWLSFKPEPIFSIYETVGFLTGLLWIWLLIKEDAWGWPAGIVSSTAYVLFFYQGKLFGDAALNLIYVGLGILGWYWWARGADRSSHLVISRTSSLALGLFGVGAAVGAMLLIPHFRAGGSPAPVADASLFCLAVVAQFLQARKKIENWPLWVMVDLGYVALYLYRGYYPTVILTLILVGLAIQGWISWKRQTRG